MVKSLSSLYDFLSSSFDTGGTNIVSTGEMGNPGEVGKGIFDDTSTGGVGNEIFDDTSTEEGNFSGAYVVSAARVCIGVFGGTYVDSAGCVCVEIFGGTIIFFGY